MVPLRLLVDNAHLAEHLRFFQSLGVTGVSLDARWRRRAGAPQPSARTAEAALAATASPVSGYGQAPAQADDLGESAPVTFARSSEEALQAIRSDIGDCTRCKLHRLGRRQIVFGVGNPSAPT